MGNPAPAAPSQGVEVARERLAAFERRVGPFFAILGVIFLIVAVIDISGLPLTATEQRWLRAAEFVIYGLFIAEFLIRLTLAEEKGRFLRQNWIGIIALALPMVRPLLVIRAVPTLASGQTLTALALTHRGFAALREITRGRQLAYVVSLTITVVLLAAGIVFYLEHGVPDSPLNSFGESLWWAATLVTTINSGDDPVSVPGRLVAVLLRIYALSIFGYITAFIATLLIGDRPASAPSGTAGTPPSP